MMARWFLTLSLLLLSVVGVRTQAPQPTGASTGPQTFSTQTNRAQHPFCNTPPQAQTPKMQIFTMNVQTGFVHGYRSNQSVIVEIRAAYPDVWRIQQVFLQVPDREVRNVYRGRGNDYRLPRKVGHWAWNLLQYNNNPDIGSTQPVDCGGMSSYGPYNMLTSLGAHAAMQMAPTGGPNNVNNNGYVSVTAKWVPPSNWENIVFRRTITIEAYVTFEKTPPGQQSTAAQFSFQTGYQAPQPQARWVKLEAQLLNLDFIDVHNFLIMRLGPMYQQYFGAAPQPAPTAPMMPREF